MRKPIIAGNWKMFKTRDEALYFILKVSTAMPDLEKVDTAVIASAPLLRDLVKRQGDNLRIGAQNLYFEDEGAFTGEISGALLKSYNVTYVVIGHSERRHIFHETDQEVNKKVHAALRHDLTPIVCVGELLEERESSKTEEVLRTQVLAAYEGLSEEQALQTVVAYEPVWAIGTGRTATSEVANEACGFVRSLLADKYSQRVADQIRIQYGGSVKPENVDELLACEHIDGALIGGASLDPDKFIKMAKAALKRV